MATPADYTAVANALLALMRNELQKLPPWEQGFIPQEKLPTAAGMAAKVAVDALDTYRARKNQEM